MRQQSLLLQTTCDRVCLQ